MRRSRNLLLWSGTWVYLFLICAGTAFLSPAIGIVAGGILLCVFAPIAIFKPALFGIQREAEEIGGSGVVFKETLFMHYAGGTMAVDRQDFLIGRTTDCAFVIPNGAALGVSRRHALIRRSANGTYCVIPQKTRNDTRLNGRVLREGEPAPLGNGDRLALGNFEMTIGIERR